MALTLLDTNVLVHAVYRGSSLHPPAARLVELGLRERGRYCISPQNLVEFMSVTSQPRFVDPPLPPAEAARMAGLLFRSRRLRKIHAMRGTVARAIREGSALGLRGARWYDFFLAMTARDAGVHTIITENTRDFADIASLAVRSIREEADAAS